MFGFVAKPGLTRRGCSSYCWAPLAPCQGLRHALLCPPQSRLGWARGWQGTWPGMPRGPRVAPSPVLSSNTHRRGWSWGWSCQGGCWSETGQALLGWWEKVRGCVCITEGSSLCSVKCLHVDPFFLLLLFLFSPPTHQPPAWTHLMSWAPAAQAAEIPETQHKQFCIQLPSSPETEMTLS